MEVTNNPWKGREFSPPKGHERKKLVEDVSIPHGDFPAIAMFFWSWRGNKQKSSPPNSMYGIFWNKKLRKQKSLVKKIENKTHKHTDEIHTKNHGIIDLYLHLPSLKYSVFVGFDRSARATQQGDRGGLWSFPGGKLEDNETEVFSEKVRWWQLKKKKKPFHLKTLGLNMCFNLIIHMILFK